jgi:predicted nucleic acid-binding protein
VTHFVFPDNTVLCNFAAVDRLDLLEAVLLGSGRWTEAVAYEARRSSRTFPELAAISKAGWLGEPIEVSDEAEVTAINRIRRAVFGGTDAEPLKHLGEAQTCHIMKTRPEFAGSWWVSDDREALRYARRQGLTTYQTIDLVRIAVSHGDMPTSEGYALLHAMAAKGRHLRLPSSPREL